MNPCTARWAGSLLLAGIAAYLFVTECSADVALPPMVCTTISYSAPSASTQQPPTRQPVLAAAPKHGSAGELAVTDLLTLKRFGYSETEIMREIERAGLRQPFTITEAQPLRQAGFSEPFIESLLQTAKLPLSGLPSARAPRLPPGYRQAATASGKGTLLVGYSTTARSATQELRDAFEQMRGYFDRRPMAGSGLREKNDQHAQATFTAMLHGTPVRGVMMVALLDDGARVALAFDEANRAADNIDTLTQALAEQLRRETQRATDDVVLRRQRFPDQSGTVHLPDGWRITFASKGMADISGPQGQSLSLGVASQVFSPRGQPGGGKAPGPVGMLLVAPMSAPDKAVQLIVPQLSIIARQANHRVPVVRFGTIIEQTPTDFPGGKGAYIHYMLYINDVPHDALSLIGVVPLSADSWMFYQSTAVAMTHRFAQDLPLLLRIWQSWQIDQSVLDERIKKARDARRETMQLIDSAQRYREQVFDNIHATWSSYFRGEADLSDLAQGANAAAGFDCWELLQAERLN